MTQPFVVQAMGRDEETLYCFDRSKASKLRHNLLTH